MKRRRRGGLDHVPSPKLGLLHHPCHQANHPHTKILYIQLVSLLWRAGNPVRNAPGKLCFYYDTAAVLFLDCVPFDLTCVGRNSLLYVCILKGEDTGKMTLHASV